ncbi:ATP-binding protein [Pedobacter gandavensis]|uniref:ATP-binding protein n=1 Tax=Pedobacter gandavensis TaxID=2679963 RepID=UPI00247A1233|nr:ATP-binding protein [Pedobacter gandavensis]WGQ11303.1 ATP-binding protein [Pedobacter gandavensis]
MKKNLILLVIAFCLYACNKDHQTNIPVSDVNFNIAESFVNKNNDSAYYHFNEVAINSKDSLLVGMSYSYMAVIQAEAGDYFGAQESLMMSLTFLNEEKKGDFSCLASDFNGLGLISLNLKKYEDAINYYDQALKYSQDTSFNLIILNNKALAYQKEKKYRQAIKLYNSILKKNNSEKEYARVLSNISKTKWLENPSYQAAPDLLKALAIRDRLNDIQGKNASYAHLADYYTKNKPDSALIYAGKMYQVAKKINSPDDQIDALKKLIDLSPNGKTKQYFDVYQKLDDSLQTARSAAKNQFAVIRYQTEKNKTDNLNLQKDNTEKKYQIIKQRVMLFVVVLLIVAGSIISVFWYKKRKQRLEQEAQNTIYENQLKTSKKVHDVVANGLYRVMNEIENQDGLDREGILDRLEDMYEKSRDISYEVIQPPSKNFHEKIADLLKSFATANTKVVFMGNGEELWENVSVKTKHEIEHILQELMVNMDKHSQCSNVAVRFERVDDHINIYYADNGIGISEETQFKNGLTNTGNRIESIHGTITFDTKAQKGFKIQISFPIS